MELLFAAEVADSGLGADAAEYGGQVGDGTDLGLFVALTLRWYYCLTLRQFLGEHGLKALADADLAQPFAQDECQRAVVRPSP